MTGFHFVILNFPGSGVAQTDVVACAAALTKQAQQHVSLPPPFGWAVTATVRAASGIYDIRPGEWVLALLPTLDVQDALGYHDINSKGAGLAKICPPLDKQDGATWTSTCSHEMLEIMGDAECTAAMQAPDGRFFALELCDPCEAAGYMIDNVEVSDFILPPWFGSPGTRMNWKGTISSPLGILPGGYAQAFTPGQGWTQLQHQEVPPRAFRLAVSGRSARRRAKHALATAILTP
jgi:hypothetical protein